MSEDFEDTPSVEERFPDEQAEDLYFGPYDFGGVSFPEQE